MRRSTRRLGAVAVTAALTLGGALAPSPAEAAPNSYSQIAADWLGSQLTGGLVHNGQFDFDDYGLTLDVFFALQQIGAGAADRSAILAAFAKNPEAYISFTDPDTHVTDRYAGATGKLATAVQLGGGDPRSFGGVNLVSRTESLLSSRANEVGRGVDRSAFENSNTIGQAWIVRALARAGSTKKTTATSFLLQQQCAAGFFRLTLEKATASSTFRCDDAASGDRAPSIDATALAVQALVSARADGVTGLGQPIADASRWLVSQQRTDGSFLDQGTANSNSTGLAATALATVGDTAPASNAAAWLVGHQVTRAVADSNAKLARQVGAVSYDAAAFRAGKTNGIPTDLQDQWRRATAQAAPALGVLLPATTLRVSAPTGYQHWGTTILTSTAGLAPGERWRTTLGSAAARTGTARQAGTSTASFTLPKATRSYTVRTTGSRDVRTGTAVVKVLAPTTLRQALASSSVKRRGTQTITVRGLAPKEKVRLLYRGAQVWTGSASAAGVVRHAFAVGSTTGRRKVQAFGKFDDRSAAASYFRVR